MLARHESNSGNRWLNLNKAGARKAVPLLIGDADVWMGVRCPVSDVRFQIQISDVDFRLQMSDFRF